MFVIGQIFQIAIINLEQIFDRQIIQPMDDINSQYQLDGSFACDSHLKIFQICKISNRNFTENPHYKP